VDNVNVKTEDGIATLNGTMTVIWKMHLHW
jgi:hypothetical protein